MEAELLCWRAGSCLPQPAAACWETALPTSLTNGAEWVLSKGEAEPPYLDWFCSWLQHLPSLCAGSHFSGHSFFSGTQASPAKCWLASKPPEPGFLSTFPAQRLLLPVLEKLLPGMGKSLPVTRVFISTWETLNFHGARKMLWIIRGWKEVLSDGLTS